MGGHAMSDTPRTDKLETQNGNKDVYASFFEMRSHAWQLERELAEALEQRDALADALREIASGDYSLVGIVDYVAPQALARLKGDKP